MKKPKISQNDVVHVAKLANLPLSKAEITKFQKQLSEILDYVNKLGQLKTKNAEPISQVTGLENIFREDETRPSLTVKEALSGAKNVSNNYFKVKAVFGER